jgi:hypothetical protein
LEESPTRIEVKVPADNVFAVAADVDDFKAWFVCQQPFCKFSTGHPAGHDEIGQHQVDGTAPTLPNLQRGSRSGCWE